MHVLVLDFPPSGHPSRKKTATNTLRISVTGWLTVHNMEGAKMRKSVAIIQGQEATATAPRGLDADTSWMAEGNCRNFPPAMFFPSDGVGVDRARRICATCSVSLQCLEHALNEHIDHGVWGGCSERERRRIAKRRRANRA